MRFRPFKLELQGIVKVNKPKPVKDEEADEIPCKEKWQIEPYLFAVQVMMQPGKNMFFSKKEQQKQDKRDWEKSGKGF